MVIVIVIDASSVVTNPTLAAVENEKWVEEPRYASSAPDWNRRSRRIQAPRCSSFRDGCIWFGRGSERTILSTWQTTTAISGGSHIRFREWPVAAHLRWPNLTPRTNELEVSDRGQNRISSPSVQHPGASLC